MMHHFLSGLEIDEETLALDSIAEVGPGGHHFGTEHTLSHYRNAFYRPIISDRRGYDNWWDDGATDAYHRAYLVAQQLLVAYEHPPTNEAVEEELREYVGKMKQVRNER
jgi:trimethylamine--corrinoid protein Co-methyltransferase